MDVWRVVTITYTFIWTSQISHKIFLLSYGEILYVFAWVDMIFECYLLATLTFAEVWLACPHTCTQGSDVRLCHYIPCLLFFFLLFCFKVLPKEDKETLELCQVMYKRGECPPLMVVFDSCEGYMSSLSHFLNLNLDGLNFRTKIQHLRFGQTTKTSLRSPRSTRHRGKATIVVQGRADAQPWILNFFYKPILYWVVAPSWKLFCPTLWRLIFRSPPLFFWMKFIDFEFVI